jgi:hypothetical protein
VNNQLDSVKFEKFVKTLTPIIEGLKRKYNAEFVYDTDKGRNEYWNDIKDSFDKGSKWLDLKLDYGRENLDLHKYSALLLVVLIKKPLFKSKAKNNDVGYSTAGFAFAWLSALHLLILFIDDGKNSSYVDYIKSRNISIPSEKYINETLRSFHINFRLFKKEQPPFPFMLADSFACEKGAWGLALLFANIFSLIETHLKDGYEYEKIRLERDTLQKELTELHKTLQQMP